MSVGEFMNIFDRFLIFILYINGNERMQHTE